MSFDIDQRIVEMQFNNQQFESNVKDSISSLDRLKEALSFGPSERNLEALDEASNSFLGDNGVGGVIATLTTKFSALEIVGIRVLQRLTDSAINYGKRMVKSLSVDQITAGFTKYKDKTESVQTIINATGKDIDYVSEVLDKLNKYTDETSYNFVDMTNNIGKFTSAGVDLETAEAAMEGIANWAAKSGANSQTASRAMYNLAQSIGTGAVKLIDWKSIENANMATKEFKEQAIEAGLALGTLTKEGDEIVTVAKGTSVSWQNFNEALKDGWFTNDVVLEVLQKYADTTTDFGLAAYHAAQEAKTFQDAIEATKDAVSTGWMKTFELIFGNYEEARVLWTDFANTLYDIFASSAEERNAMLKDWHDLGGREKLIEGIASAYHNLMDIVEPLKEIFREFFPKTSADSLYAWTNAFDRFINTTLKPSEGFIENVGDIFRGLVSTLKTLFGVGKGFITIIKPIISGLIQIGSKVIDAAAGFGRFISVLNDYIAENHLINDAAQTIATAFGRIIESIKSFFGKFEPYIDKIKKLFDKLFPSKDNYFNGPVGFFDISSLSGVKDAEELLGDMSKNVERVHDRFAKAKSIVEAFGKKIKAVSEKIRPYADRIKELLSEFFGKKEVKDTDTFIPVDAFRIAEGFLEKTDKSVTALDTHVKNLGEKLRSFGEAVKGIFDKIFNSGIEKINSLFFGTSDGAERASENLEKVNNKLSPFKKLLESLKEFASAVFEKLKGIWDIVKLIGNTVWNLVSTAFTGLTNAIKGISFKNLTDDAAGGLEVFNGALIASILLGIKKFVGGFTKFTADLSSITDSLGKIKDAVIDTFGAFQENLKAKTLKELAGAIAILTLSIVVLSGLDTEKLIMATGAVKILFMELTAALDSLTGIDKAFGKNTNLSAMTTSLIKLSAAILILSIAMKNLSKLDIEGLSKGLAGVGALLFMLGTFSKNMDTEGFGKGSGKGIIAMSIALLILSKAIQRIGSMDMKTIGKGLIGIAGALVAFGVYAKIVGKDAKAISSAGLSILLISTSMIILGKAMEKFSSFSWEEIGKGLAVLAGSLLAMTIALKFIPATAALGATGFLIMSASLLILGKALKNLGSLSWEEIARGLVALGGSLLILSVSMAAMSLGVAGAGAMLVMTAALLAFIPVLKYFGGTKATNVLKAIGLMALAFGVLAVAGVALGVAAPGLLAVSAALLLLSGSLLVAGVGLTLITTALSALTVVMPLAATALATLITTVVTAFGQALLNLLGTVASTVPQIVSIVLSTISEVLTALVENLPSIVEKVVVLLTDLLTILAEHVPDFIGAAVDFVVGMITGLGEKLPDLLDAGTKFIIDFINGLADAIDNNKDDFFAAMDRLVESIWEFLKDFAKHAVEKFKEKAKEIMDSGFIQGIKDKFEEGRTAIHDFITNLVEGIKEKIEDIKKAAKDVVDGFTNGIKEKWEGVKEAGRNLGSKAINGIKSFLGINSPSKAFRDIGRYSDEGLINGLMDFSHKVEKAGGFVGKTAFDSVSKAIDGLGKLINDESNYEPVITPVVDLSNVYDGASEINGVLSGQALSVKAIDGQIKYEGRDLTELIDVGYKVLSAIQNGSDLYLDDDILAGRINRRLGLA